MGRLREGEVPTSQASSYRDSTTKRAYREPAKGIKKSRRRPHGVRSLLNVAPNTPPKEVAKAIDEHVRRLCVECRSPHISAQKRGAITRKMTQLRASRRDLFAEEETSTARCQRHRLTVPKTVRQQRHAKDVCRKRIRAAEARKVKITGPAWGRPYAVRVGCKATSSFGEHILEKGEVVKIEGSNSNNGVTAAHIIIKRPREVRRRDRRLSKYAAVPVETIRLGARSRSAFSEPLRHLAEPLLPDPPPIDWARVQKPPRPKRRR